LTIHLVKKINLSRMTYMRSWKSHRFTSHTWLGLNPQIGRPLSRIVGAIGFNSWFCNFRHDNTFSQSLMVDFHIFFIFKQLIYLILFPLSNELINILAKIKLINHFLLPSCTNVVCNCAVCTRKCIPMAYVPYVI
jgi:hypothetical protein